MKKRTNKITTIALLMILHSAAYALDYCENGSYGNQFMWIESISSDSFVNDSGPFNNHYGDQDHLYIGYADYSNQIIELGAEPNTIELVPGRFSHPALNELPTYWQLWIDLNADQSFSDDELLLSTGSLNTVIENIDLSHLTLNNDLETRMRISVSFSPNAPVCGSIEHGEVEDYTVVIKPVIETTFLVPEEYSSIQAAIDAATPGAQVLVNDGHYSEHLVIEKPLTLESVNGQEFTTINAEFQTAIWVKSSNVTIKGFDFTANRGSGDNIIFFDEGAHDGKSINNHCGINGSSSFSNTNIRIYKANRITVDGLFCHALGAYGISAEETMDSRFINNTLTRHLQSGIQVINGSDVEIENNVLNENFNEGLLLSDSVRISVSNNECSYTLLGFNGLGISVNNSTEVNLHNNQCIRNKFAGVRLIHSDDIALTNNSLINNNQVGLDVFYSNHVWANNNTFDDNFWGGIVINTTVGSLFENNLITNTGFYGIRTIFMSDTLIANNQIQDNWGSLSFDNSTDNILSGNSMDSTALDSSSCFIKMAQATNNKIYLNTLSMAANSQICSDSLSNNQWSTSEVLEYQYLGQAFANQLGNFYSNGDHSDGNNDGISDLPYVLPGNEAPDNHALSDTVENYIFQQ